MNHCQDHLTQKLNCIIIADQILNPENLSGDEAILNLSEVIIRNQPIINAFPEIFGNYEQLLSVCDEIDIEKIFSDTSNIRRDQLLHIPGRLHEYRLSASASRKKQGAYYTPPYIIRYMIEVSLKCYIENGRDFSFSQPKIIDPACGGGSFLIETFNILVDKGLSEEKAIQCVFGTDIDKEAVRTAVFVLTLAVTARNRSLELLYVKHLWEKQVRVGNALNPVQITIPFATNQNSPENFINWLGCFSPVFTAEPAGFDIVIGNPPYVSNKLISPDQKRLYKSNFTTALGQYDLSVLFFEQGVNLLKKGGVLSFITSNKFMAADYGKNLRKKLLDTCEIHEMVDVSTLKCFKNTAVYPVIISIRKKPPEKDFGIRLFKIEAWDELNNKKPVVVNQEFFKGNREYILTTQLTDSTLSILQKIENAGDRIPEGKIRCGLAETGFNKWITKDCQPVKGDQDKFHPFIQAGHIEAFTIKGRDFIDKTKFKSDRWLIGKGPKLVIPGLSKEMKAAVDFSDSLLGRVYFIRDHDTKYDLGYLAVLLNSYVLNFYYKVMYWPVHLEGGYLRFNSTYLANLPLYEAENSNPEKALLIHEITQIGNIMISGNLSDTDFKEMQDKAEALVFLLYEVSANDISILMEFLELPAETRERVFDYFIRGGKTNAGKEN